MCFDISIANSGVHEAYAHVYHLVAIGCDHKLCDIEAIKRKVKVIKSS